MLATENETVADFIERLGGIPAHHIRLKPAPGTATEDDVIRWLDSPNKRMFELIDGTLVEKAAGIKEAALALFLGRRLLDWAEENDAGIAIGPDGPSRLRLGMVRYRDISFIPWDRMPVGELPDDSVSKIIPVFAVEILSPTNTPREIELKLDNYFQAAVRMAWVIDPDSRTALIYTARNRRREVASDGELSGGRILPGLRVSMPELFGCLRRKKRKPR